MYALGFEVVVAEWLNSQIRQRYSIETEFHDDGVGFESFEMASCSEFGVFRVSERLEQLVDNLKLSSNRALAVDL